MDIKQLNNQIKNPSVMTTPFLFMQEHKNQYHQFAQDSLKGIEDPDMLSEVFFSQENIDIIQRGLIYNVFIASNKKFLITKQSEQDLMVVMRAFFLTGALHSNCIPIKTQVEKLNEMVINELTPNILSAINMKQEYLRVINNPISQIDRPQNMSSAGNRSLPSVTNLF